MANVGETYKIDLDELFQITGGDRVLPCVEDTGTTWWRYLADDDEGAWCMYTWRDGAEPGDLYADYVKIAEENNLFPSIFDETCAIVLAEADGGGYRLRMLVNPNPGFTTFTDGGLYIPDFVLTEEEMENCAYKI